MANGARLVSAPVPHDDKHGALAQFDAIFHERAYTLVYLLTHLPPPCIAPGAAGRPCGAARRWLAEGGAARCAVGQAGAAAFLAGQACLLPLPVTPAKTPGLLGLAGGPPRAGLGLWRRALPDATMADRGGFAGVRAAAPPRLDSLPNRVCCASVLVILMHCLVPLRELLYGLIYNILTQTYAPCCYRASAAAVATVVVAVSAVGAGTGATGGAATAAAAAGGPRRTRRRSGCR